MADWFEKRKEEKNSICVSRSEPQERQSVALRLTTTTATRDDRCSVFGPFETVQHTMRAAIIAAFARDYCDHLISVLLASQAPRWEASDKISALWTPEEPR